MDTYIASRRILSIQADAAGPRLVSDVLPACYIVSTSSCAVALTRATEAAFDCYVIGEGLAGVGAIGLCRQIRGVDPDTPILFYCGDVSARCVAAALSAGASVHLRRPAADAILAATLAGLLRMADLTSAKARSAERRCIVRDVRRRLADRDARTLSRDATASIS
jgi:DNA-binding response OmpR family regulator